MRRQALKARRWATGRVPTGRDALPPASVPAARSLQGFTLLELAVSMAVFLIISSVAFLLFYQQQASSQVIQGQVGLNLALRNAASQLEMDLANAGSNFFPTTPNTPNGQPAGITIVNNIATSTSPCDNPASLAYGANCFDSLNIIMAADPNAYPPVHVTGVGAGACSDTSDPSGTAYSSAATGLDGTLWTLAATAAEFQAGDQILFLNSSNTQMTSVVLTQNAQVSGGAVQFRFMPTNPDGSNSRAYDPLDITTCLGNSSYAQTTACTPGFIPTDLHPLSTLTSQFCPTDWIVKLASVRYSVDSSNANDPVLVRQQSGYPTSVVMEQIIGFKVGAAIWNTGISSDNSSYCYSAASYALLANSNCDNSGETAQDEAYNYRMIRSVRVSVIGRTAPNWNPNYTYRNSLDQGPYQVQGVSVVVNPRNLSMND
jgi:prepilin-type N-terminal cleavage/methylation domain-containing protein